jgi:hyperosmotically inducible periplasmic protein
LVGFELQTKGTKMNLEQLKRSGLGVYLIIACIAVIGFGCAGDRYSRSTGDYIDDKAVQAKVKGELLRDDLVNPFDVKVDTYRGEVLLSGFVSTPEQKKRAEEISRNVPGVRSVINNLILKTDGVGAPSASVSGASSSASARTEVNGDRTRQTDRSLAPARNLDISASNGKATIRGTVDSSSEKSLVERKVRELPGITSVDNQLRVRGTD